MARKSKRNLAPEKTSLKDNQKFKAAGYARVSIDKGEDKNSMETQLLMIRQYITDHSEYDLIETYTDIGYSGTDFERPDFTKMIEDVKNGKINCIIVKDLSRFGRNYIETGFYIETMLPRLNAKLVAINDRFDSSNEADRNRLEIPIKNLINEMYARDSSKKYTEAFLLHSRLGDSKIGLAPYGYIVNKEQNVLEKDPETAPIVEIIFRWFEQGVSMAQIARRIEKIGVLTPAQYKFEKYGIPPNNQTDYWTGAIVRNILYNPVYVGDTVQGRTKDRKYTGEHIRHVDKADWIIHRDTHVPLVPREEYSKVEALLLKNANNRRERIAETLQNRGDIANPFKNKIYCACCGNAMKFMKYQHGGSKDGFDSSFFLCCDNKKPYCNRRVYTDYLKIIVMDQIKKYIKIVCNQKELAKKLLNGADKRTYCLSNEKKLMSLEKKEADNASAIEKLYVNFANQIIDEEDYKLLLRNYSEEREKIRSDIRKQKSELLLKRKTIEQYNDFINRFEHVVDEQEYSQEVVDDLIDRIYIGENNTIEIVFSCNDEIQNALQVIGESKQ